MNRSPLVLALVLCLVPVARADVASPAAVVAVEVDDASTLVAWSSVGSVDAYRVYGVTMPGVHTFLDEVPADPGVGGVAVVAAGYASYAVSAVVGGVEGEPTYATRSACVSYEDDPPGLSVGPSCVFDLIEKARGILRA